MSAEKQQKRGNTHSSPCISPTLSTGRHEEAGLRKQKVSKIKGSETLSKV